MPRRSGLRLVGAPHPTDIFNDLDALRHEQRSSGRGRRQRATETFARVPHDRALALYRRVGGAVWVLLFELDRLILKGNGRNPIKLASARMNAAGLNHYTRRRALRRLEGAGVVQVEWRGKGRSPWVTHLWYPRRE